MKLAIGNDHAGYEMKLNVLNWLILNGHDVTNFGTDSTDSVDYPDYVHAVVYEVKNGNFDFGILIRGIGQGIFLSPIKNPYYKTDSY